MEGNFVSLAPEMFTQEGSNAICWKGVYYYKACDAFVRDLPGGGRSFCAKRVDHPSKEHEDYQGRIRLEDL